MSQSIGFFSAPYRFFYMLSFSWIVCLSTSPAYGQGVVSDNIAPSLEVQKAPESAVTSDSLSEILGLGVMSGIQYDTSFVKKKLRKRDQKLTIFGYYRLFLYGRYMSNPYPGLAPFENAYGVGDGYREPMLSMTVLGRPNGKTSFGSELFVFTPYLGDYTQDNQFTMNLGINFYGNFRTEVGNFGIRAGGIHWYNLSPFTIGVYQVLDRFSIFDRTPWEGVSHTDKYDAYYQTGATNPGDLRWNFRPFNGFILNGAELPGNINTDLFWGKTDLNGGLPGAITDPAASIPPTLDAGNIPTYLGLEGTSRTFSNIMYGGRIAKTFGRTPQTISYNFLHNEASLDSLSLNKRNYQVHSLGLDLQLGPVGVEGELAAGYYESPTYSRKWGEALMLRFKTPQELTFLPLDLQVYQISPDFYNQNGEILTNSNPAIQQDVGMGAGEISAGGLLTQVNQLAHNRRGVNLNTGIELGAFKFNLGWGIAQELEANTTTLSYIHRINGLALSRIYNPFPGNATGPTVFGPYGRQFSFFRGVSEVVQTTDVDPATATAINKKVYNSVDIQAKFKTSILERPLYLFYLGTFSSARSQGAPVPVYDEDTYLFAQYHEWDLYYELIPDFILTGYLGIENVRGGRFTESDAETQLPRDQFGTGIGLGFDWLLSETSGLYFRHRWMDFEDRNFGLNEYKGREITIELKTFF